MKKPNGAGSILYHIDNARNLPGVINICFDEDISETHLKEALSKTLKIYPLVSAGVYLSDETSWFVENERPLRILHQKQCVRPGSEKLNGHWICINYDGAQLYVALSHAITDGTGMFWFVKTLCYYYCCLKYRKEFTPQDIRILPGGTYPDDEADYWGADFSDVKPISAADYEKKGYILPEHRSKEEQRNIYVKLSIPEYEFMKFVKENAASPSVMIFVLLAMAVYEARPEAKQPIIGRLTVDARKGLALEHTFLNCSLGAHLSADRQTLLDMKLSELCAKMRKSLKQQTTPEYLRWLAKELIREKAFLPDVKPTVSISYMGKITFGEYEKHIRSFLMIEEEYHKLNAFVYDGDFHLILHFGNGSEIYGAAMAEILKRNGISVHQGKPIFLENAL